MLKLRSIFYKPNLTNISFLKNHINNMQTTIFSTQNNDLTILLNIF